MTMPSAPLNYAGVHSEKCPVCYERPETDKTLYGYYVCKKCRNRFANRRQLAYLIDSVLFTIPAIGLVALSDVIVTPSLTQAEDAVLGLFFGIGFTALFNFRDGFAGQSPGKRLTGVQVVDDATGRPISFARSFKRNWFFLFGVIPIAGGLASLALFIIVVVQMMGGYRLGDRAAGTRVIWKKYADSPVFGGRGTLCRSCGYDLTGNESGKCSECGTPVTVSPSAVPLASPIL